MFKRLINRLLLFSLRHIDRILICLNVYKNNFLVNRLKYKGTIKVVFLMLNVDTWKYHALYKQLIENEKFEVKVCICPFTGRGQDFLLKEYRRCILYCEENGYDYILGYDTNLKRTNKIKKIFNPDIVFFSNPNSLTNWYYTIYNFYNKLCCYVPYSFRIDRLYQYSYNNTFVNLTWLNFYETIIHKKLAEKYAYNKGINVIASGFPHLDTFRRLPVEDVWKKQSHVKKKIIWAPHWTIKGYQETGLDWSCFLTYAEEFFALAREHQDVVQFAFKPHPFLRNILENDKLWGKDKTDEYFQNWQEVDNCQLVEGDYIDLFKTSDALIHDSGSFMVEYLVVNKPVAYTLNDNNPITTFNEFGQKAFSCHEIIETKENLKSFVIAIIDNEDSLSAMRNRVVLEEMNFSEKNISLIIEESILKLLS